jgi:hypothetical protein
MFTFRKTAQPTGSIHPFRRFDPPLPPENRPPGSIHSLRRFDPSSPPENAGMTLRAFHHSNSQAEFSLRIPQNCSIQRTASVLSG